MKKASLSRKKATTTSSARPAKARVENEKRIAAPGLRKRAENKLAVSPKRGVQPEIDALKLVHELQVHQIELEMQNEELLRAAAAAGESRARYSDLYDFAPVGYATLDDKEMVLEANLTFARLMGLARSLMLRKRFSSFVAPQDRDSFKTHIQGFISAGGKTTFEIKLVRKNNCIFDAQIETAGLKNSGTSAQQYLLAIFDVSERKTLDDALRRSEARLESLLRITQYQAASSQDLLDFALKEAISLTSSKLGYIYHYDQAKREFTLDTWSKGVMEECTIAEKQTVYQLDNTGIWGEAVRQAKPIIVNDFHAPNPLKKGYPEGHSALHNFLTVPVFIQGRIVGVVGAANKKDDYTDSDSRQLTLLMNSVWTIMERKSIAARLDESEKRYRNLFESMEEGFALCEMVYDASGKPIDFRYIDVNPAFARLTGLPVERVNGQHREGTDSRHRAVLDRNVRTNR